MSPLADFLQRLFAEGVALFRAPPAAAPCGDAEALLESAYAMHALDVAGPPIPFDAGIALAAAEGVRHACWLLVNRDGPEEEIDRRLRLPGPAASAAQHLSADLTLRYLAQVHRRALALSPEDRLAAALADLLRHWPLSGVLSDVAEAPMGDLTFGGHDGLLLLYAERLAAHEKPAWVPPGRGAEFLDLVLGGRPSALRPVAEGGGDERA
jgi:hypothetical protein